MLAIKIEITKFIDHHQPGFVEARLFDVWSREYIFQEKLPIFTSDDLDNESDYPKPGVIACIKVKEFYDNTNCKIIVIDTNEIWGVQSLDERREFEVLENQLIEI